MSVLTLFIVVCCCSCLTRRQVTRRWRCFTLLSKRSMTSFPTLPVSTLNLNMWKKLPQVLQIIQCIFHLIIDTGYDF